MVSKLFLAFGLWQRFIQQKGIKNQFCGYQFKIIVNKERFLKEFFGDLIFFCNFVEDKKYIRGCTCGGILVLFVYI